MSIPRIDFFNFLFNAGKGIRTNQLTGSFVKLVSSRGIATQQDEDDTESTVDIHDSSAAGATAQDHRRLSALEQITRDLHLREHTDWSNVPDANLNVWALHILPRSDFSSVDEIPGFPWAGSKTVPVGAGGIYRILLRIQVGRDVTGSRVTRADADGTPEDPLNGVFDDNHDEHGWIAELTQGGYTYYLWTGEPNLSEGDVLTVQHSTTEEHTEFDGDTPALARHAADPVAHQDSPRRQPVLGIDAPVGREVYLTRVARHAPMEQIFSVPLGPLEPNGPQGTTIYTGASLLDFTAVGGVSATPDTSGFPAVMHRNRVAAVWQRDGLEGWISLAVASALAAQPPTELHIPTYRGDLAIALVQHGNIVNVGGTNYRIMRTTGAHLSSQLSSDYQNGNPFRFALRYAGGYLKADGTLEDGVDHAIGHYQSVGGGQWRSRMAGLIADIAAASDAEKFALVAALRNTAPEVLYTENAASQKSLDVWTNIQLNREIINADLGKIIVLRFWNTRREAETEFSVRRFLALTPMNPSDDQFDERAIAVPIYSGTGGPARTFKQGIITPIFVGRPTEAVQTFSRMILGTDAFGNQGAVSWQDFQMQIELRTI